MADIKDFLAMFEDVPRTEKIMISLSKYCRSRGGGILWIISYGLLYIFSFYGMASVFNYSTPNILKSLTYIIFIIVGFIFFLSVGVFLIWGVNHQMSVMRQWHKQQFNDFKRIDHNIFDLIDKFIKDHPMGSPWLKEISELRNSLQTFENRYFPKKED